MTGKLVLASASPRRMELLAWAGISCEVYPSHTDESAHPGEAPWTHVLRLALAKAEEVARQKPLSWVLAADTVVALKDLMLGKPGNRDEAFRMLRALSGQAHQVWSGICLMNRDLDRVFVDHVVTEVEFRPLTDKDINRYVASGEVWDKAGAYAVQGRGAVFTSRINGSYTNVIGLPMAEVLAWLRQVGLAD